VATNDTRSTRIDQTSGFCALQPLNRDSILLFAAFNRERPVDARHLSIGAKLSGGGLSWFRKWVASTEVVA